MRDAVAEPLGHVFGGRVDIPHDVIDEGVVEAVHDFLDLAEIDDHAVVVDFLALDGDGDDPVMAMQVRALAFIIEVQVMRPGYFHSLCYGKHNIPFSAQRAGSLTPFAANAAARSIQVPQVPQGFSPPS